MISYRLVTYNHVYINQAANSFSQTAGVCGAFAGNMDGTPLVESVTMELKDQRAGFI